MPAANISLRPIASITLEPQADGTAAIAITTQYLITYRKLLPPLRALSDMLNMKHGLETEVRANKKQQVTEKHREYMPSGTMEVTMHDGEIREVPYFTTHLITHVDAAQTAQLLPKIAYYLTQEVQKFPVMHLVTAIPEPLRDEAFYRGLFQEISQASHLSLEELRTHLLGELLCEIISTASKAKDHVSPPEIREGRVEATIRGQWLENFRERLKGSYTSSWLDLQLDDILEPAEPGRLVIRLDMFNDTGHNDKLLKLADYLSHESRQNIRMGGEKVIHIEPARKQRIQEISTLLRAINAYVELDTPPVSPQPPRLFSRSNVHPIVTIAPGADEHGHYLALASDAHQNYELLVRAFTQNYEVVDVELVERLHREASLERKHIAYSLAAYEYKNHHQKHYRPNAEGLYELRLYLGENPLSPIAALPVVAAWIAERVEGFQLQHLSAILAPELQSHELYEAIFEKVAQRAGLSPDGLQHEMHASLLLHLLDYITRESGRTGEFRHITHYSPNVEGTRNRWGDLTGGESVVTAPMKPQWVTKVEQLLSGQYSSLLTHDLSGIIHPATSAHELVLDVRQFKKLAPSAWLPLVNALTAEERTTLWANAQDKRAGKHLSVYHTQKRRLQEAADLCFWSTHADLRYPLSKALSSLEEAQEILHAYPAVNIGDRVETAIQQLKYLLEGIDSLIEHPEAVPPPHNVLALSNYRGILDEGLFLLRNMPLFLQDRADENTLEIVAAYGEIRNTPLSAIFRECSREIAEMVQGLPVSLPTLFARSLLALFAEIEAETGIALGDATTRTLTYYSAGGQGLPSAAPHLPLSKWLLREMDALEQQAHSAPALGDALPMLEVFALSIEHEEQRLISRY